MAVLVTYGTKHGATAGIAERIVDRLHQHGVGAEARRVSAIEDLGVGRGGHRERCLLRLVEGRGDGVRTAKQRGPRRLTGMALQQ